MIFPWSPIFVIINAISYLMGLFLLQYRKVKVELANAPLSYREQLTERVRQFKQDIASLRRQLNGGSSVREELFSRQQDDDPYQVCI